MLSLICDDDYAWRRVTARAIGGTVLSADTIAGALTLAKRMQPSVILLDVILPDGIGWESIPGFKQAAPYAEIVVMTAHGRRCDALRSVGEHGAFAYLDKCEGLEALLRTVRRAFNSSVVAAVRGRSVERARFAVVRR
jgi:two-component system NtrC family response regulator